MSTSATITLEMDDLDFERLVDEGVPWRRFTKDEIADRFETYPMGTDKRPVNDTASLDWRMAYWVGEEYSNVLLARAFLLASGHECELVFDLVPQKDDDTSPYMGWVLLTNYVSLTWRHIIEEHGEQARR